MNLSSNYSLSLFIFRRDLRLFDNSALLSAMQQSKTLLPIFIFDDRQLHHNPYHNQHAIQFMLESLRDLASAIKNVNGQLYYFEGIAEEVTSKLLSTLPIDAVFINRDYTPFSKLRDDRLKKVCEKNKVAFHCYADALLHEPEETLKQDHTPYTVFTPYFNYCAQLSVSKPVNHAIQTNFYTKPIVSSIQEIPSSLLIHQFASQSKGGRKVGLTILKSIDQLNQHFAERDFPAKDTTSHLSPHLKFGTVSIREVYYAAKNTLKNPMEFIRALHWRDFFTHIAFHFPHVFGHSFKPIYDQLQWDNHPEPFKRWQQGLTGFPIVDAGMRELLQSGNMHNRVRMIAASFLVKDLHIDWRWGEKHFAQHLLDYDPSVNNGNWQWCASTGCDAQPYFRIFNPWLQQKKFDPDCVYIKQWIPELRTTPVSVIQQWYQAVNQHQHYPAPMIQHGIESKMALSQYQACRDKTTDKE